MLLFCVCLVLFSIMPLRFANLFHVSIINIFFANWSYYIEWMYSLFFVFVFHCRWIFVFFFFQFGAILCTTAYEHLCKVLCGYVFNYLEHSTILMLTVQNQVVSFIRLKVQSSQDCPQPAVNWGFPCHKHFWTIAHKLRVPTVLESNFLEHLIEIRKML